MSENKKAREYTLFIPGRPYTKKNSGRYVGHGRYLPSKQFCAYEDRSLPVLNAHKRNLGLIEPIDYPVEVTALYVMDSRSGWPDLVGLMQATADLLETAGILEDDRVIVSWGTTHIAKVDRKQPGVGIRIREWTDTDWFNPLELDPFYKRRNKDV